MGRGKIGSREISRRAQQKTKCIYIYIDVSGQAGKTVVDHGLAPNDDISHVMSGQQVVEAVLSEITSALHDEPYRVQ